MRRMDMLWLSCLLGLGFTTVLFSLSAITHKLSTLIIAADLQSQAIQSSCVVDVSAVQREMEALTKTVGTMESRVDKKLDLISQRLNNTVGGKP